MRDGHLTERKQLPPRQCRRLTADCCRCCWIVVAGPSRRAGPSRSRCRTAAFETILFFFVRRNERDEPGVSDAGDRW